jgi:hypothetical protein
MEGTDGSNTTGLGESAGPADGGGLQVGAAKVGGTVGANDVTVEHIYEALCVVAQDDWAEQSVADANRILDLLDCRSHGGKTHVAWTDLRADIAAILVDFASSSACDPGTAHHARVRDLALMLADDEAAN